MKQPAPLFFFLTLLFFLFIPGVSEAEEVDAAADLALDLVGENDQGYITSELVQYVYKESKSIYLPRSAADQWVEGEEVESLQAGDVVFFQGTHLMSGIYINDGRFVIVTSEGISERNLETSEYWSNAYQGAKRHSEDSSPLPQTMRL
ncbi:C40 family peptidase [Halobacillus andaensis]|uniref:C40 family peptidase n=1 Tax=Halobacillus andaensis TaxID=1176239 RepID=UPI003D75570F